MSEEAIHSNAGEPTASQDLCEAAEAKVGTTPDVRNGIEVGIAPDACDNAGVVAAPDACDADVPEAAPGACDGATEHACCECRHKNTERSAAFQADIQKRLNRAIGQLNGVKSMIEDNRYCGDVLTQLAAAESAIHRTAEIILQDHMETCVVEQVRAGNVEVVDEAMKLIRKFM